MNKMLVWFHSFPEASAGIDDEQLFEQVRVSAFQTASEKQQARKLFAGNFNEFSEFISEQSEIADIEILLPAREVLYTRVSVPSKSKKRIMQAIPFILEDNLIKDIDKEFFAMGDVINGQCDIAIVHRSIIEKIFRQFKKLSVSVSMMTSELFQLPWYQGNWSVSFLQDEVLIRTGEQSGVVFDAINSEFMFRLLLTKTDTEEINKPESITIFSQPECKLTEKLQLLAQEYEIDSKLETGDWLNFALNESALAKKGRSTTEHKGINLFQGEFHPGNIKTVKIPFVKTLSAIVIISILSQIAFMVYQMQYFKNELDNSKTELKQLYFKTFPESKRLRDDVRFQVENKLRQLQKNASANDSFLNLLGIVGQELRQINNLKIHNIRYVDGILQVDIRSKDFVFNKLESAIQDKHGLLVEEKSSSKMKNEVQTVVNFRLSNT